MPLANSIIPPRRPLTAGEPRELRKMHRRQEQGIGQEPTGRIEGLTYRAGRCRQL